MRKIFLATAATAALFFLPSAVTAAFADTVDSSEVTPQADSDQSPAQMGMDTDVARPGADPNVPSDYAYLPPDMQPPTAGPRINVPQAPAAGASSVSSGAGAGGTSTDGSTTTDATTADSTNGVSQGSQSASPTLPDLALGKSYTIGTEWPDATFAKSEANYANTGQLTDGKVASLSYSDKGWVGMLRQYGRSVTIDLGSEENVQELSLDFLQNLGAGIDFPDSVTYYASDDGQNWYAVGKAWSSSGGGDYTPQSQAFQVTTDVNARYIRAQFNDKVFAFLDEFAVYGTATPQNGTKPLVGRGQDMTQTTGNGYLVDPSVDDLPDVGMAKSLVHLPPGFAEPASPSGYLTPTDANAFGVKNMQLVYTGSNGSIGTWSASDFLPMVAAEDASGKPQGWMFDASLFGPYSNNTPTSAAGWSAWLTDLFTANQQLSALDQAVGQLKQQLNDPNFKEKIVITIPGLSSNPSDFGAIDSSGQNVDLNAGDVGPEVALANKIRVIDWYMQQVQSDWSNAHFSNLSLVGYYWSPESQNVTDPLDADLIQATSLLVHQDRLGFYWIPYYGAPGITSWRQLGFDDVMIQPGVSFNWSIDPAARLGSAAAQAQYYHTGLEMEQHWDVVSSVTHLAQTAQNKYFDYFTGGNVYGYEQNVMHSWYLNSKTLLTAYQNSNPFYHQVYDNTVQFVNGKWTSTTFQ